MDLMGRVVMDTGGGGAMEVGLLGGRSSWLLKHGRGNAAGGEDHGWGGRAMQARTTASIIAGDVVEAAKAVAPFLLGWCSPGHDGEQMLSFSSASTAIDAAAAVADGGAMPLYYGTPASCSGDHG